MRQGTHKFGFKKKAEKTRAPAPADTGPLPIVWMPASAHRVEREIKSGAILNFSTSVDFDGLYIGHLFGEFGQKGFSFKKYSITSAAFPDDFHARKLTNCLMITMCYILLEGNGELLL